MGNCRNYILYNICSSLFDSVYSRFYFLFYDGQRYLSEQSVGRMETPYCTPWSRGHSFMQCVPLRLQTNIYGQSRMYYHLGIAYGTLSYMGYNPDTRDGVVIISTGASQSYDSRGIWCICAELADYFYNN